MILPEARGPWNQIEDRLRSYVARRVVSSDVDDVLQEIFIKINGGMTNLRDGERFGGWVYRIAAHAVADLGRARRRDPLAQAAEPREEPSSTEEADALPLLGPDPPSENLRAIVGRRRVCSFD